MGSPEQAFTSEPVRMKTLWITLCLFVLAAAENTIPNHETTKAPPCWADQFPTLPPNHSDSSLTVGNEFTCNVCTKIFQGLDDALLNNEHQIAHALENLCEGMPWFFEICWRVVESCTDELIEMLIQSGLNPKDMCETLMVCP